MADLAFHWKLMSEVDPALYEKTSAWRAQVGSKTRMTPKDFELVRVAVAMSLGGRLATRSHTEMALKKGATKEEIFEILSVVMMMGGIALYREACEAVEDLIG
jgi:alkylhydroperoxidase/carboxymuconolactone decarboxylase family protein YurZ